MSDYMSFLSYGDLHTIGNALNPTGEANILVLNDFFFLEALCLSVGLHYVLHVIWMFAHNTQNTKTNSTGKHTCSNVNIQTRDVDLKLPDFNTFFMQ